MNLITKVDFLVLLLFFFESELVRRLFQISHVDEVRFVFFGFLDLVQPANEPAVSRRVSPAAHLLLFGLRHFLQGRFDEFAFDIVDFDRQFIDLISNEREQSVSRTRAFRLHRNPACGL